MQELTREIGFAWKQACFLFLFSTFFEMLLCWFSHLQMVLALFQEI